MRKHIIYLTLITFFALTLYAQNSFSAKFYELKGILKTQNCEVIAGANLYFTKDGLTEVVPTNINGEFVIKLPAGDFEITVNRVISEDFRAFVKIKEGAPNPQNLEFTVKTRSNPCGLKEGETCRKPLKLPKPAYPFTARAVNATGEVLVAVRIDRDGRVRSAKAVGGHPLLRRVAEQAAMNSEFEASAADNEETEIKMTYVFLSTGNEKEGLRRYKNLYRVEFLSDLVVKDNPSY